jgi:hypothetical protein
MSIATEQLHTAEQLQTAKEALEFAKGNRSQAERNLRHNYGWSDDVSLKSALNAAETVKATAPANAPSDTSVPPPMAEKIATKFVEAGAHVIFMPRGTKRCTIPGWEEKATNNLEAALKWAAQDTYANVGIVGKKDGLWGCDDDAGLIAEYEAQYGPIQTYTTRTVSGGRHFIFQQNAESWAMGNVSIKDDQNRELLSARVDDRYVVAAGSWAYPHNDETQPLTQYTAIDPNAPFIEAPSSLIAFIKAKDAGYKAKKSKPNTTAASNEVRLYHEGGRNDGLTRKAGKLRDAGADHEMILQKLHEWNQKLCVPPLPDEEVESIAKSVARYSEGQDHGLQLNQKPSEPVATQPQPWGKVLPLKNILRPVLPFLPEYLPRAIRPWCKDVSERMGVPVDLPGIAALETIAGVIGRRAFVYPMAHNKEWKESIAISGGYVADSGTKKTPVWKLPTNIVVELEMDLKREHEQKVKQFEAAVSKIAQAYKTVKAAEKRGSVPAPETVALANQQPPQEPGKPPRLVLNDATPEKAHLAMSENPYGLLYYRDELASWVAELDKEGREAQRGMFLAAMTGNDYYALDRIERGEVFAVMCLSVCGNFQPNILRMVLADERNIDDGMIPRFQLLVWPDETKIKPRDRAADIGAKEKFRHVIRTLAAIKTEAVDLHFDDEAQKLRDQWDEELLAKIKEEKHHGKKSHLSKYSGSMPKIAALFQLVDLVELGGGLLGSFRIDAEHTRLAINLFRYLESHMHRVYDSACEPVQVAEADIARRILAGEMPDMMSVRDIQRDCWKGLKGLSADQISLALENLADRGYVRPVWSQPGPAGGRPVIRWEVNPATNPGF